MVNWAIFLFTTSDTRARHALFQTHIAESPNRPQYDVARHGRFLIVTDLQDAVTELTHHLKLVALRRNKGCQRSTSPTNGHEKW